MKQTTSAIAVAVIAAGLWSTVAPAEAAYGWRGKRTVSRQDPNDLFYNYYVGPQPSGTAAEMYVAPLPVPVSMGHTYTTYQPLMPHEMLYQHHRSYYTHSPGAGWTRTNVSYHSKANWLQAAIWDSHNWGENYGYKKSGNAWW
ncbi:hypothetical protein Pla175_06550 [Pirellulimonas nuda]|uniref:Uncharacterized protein n=1 Tax=Pirellulimonas nuda TaxID=2528009 RepID=A0A518D768_9BACT|nr:hypothetical protein [Pirellulimonas nuda]QDU87296.1 hypothetical protein Pla175_06550 [Pirellulimonas nuda]